MKRLLIFTFLVPFILYGQKTFRLPSNAKTDTIHFKGYKTFLVYPNIDYKVSLNQSKLFKVDTSLANKIDKAIFEQYLLANEKYLVIEEKKDPYPFAPIDSTKLTISQIKADRRKSILGVSENKIKKQLNKYDKYYFGFENTKGEEWVFIMFDPHKIKFFNSGREQHIKNISTMVFNVRTRKLYFAGWSGQGE